MGDEGAAPSSLFCRSLLFSSGSGQGVRQTVIALVTGVFEYRPDGFLPRHFCRPRSCPGGLIFNCELITNGVISDAGEALDQAHLFAGSLECRPIRKVRRLDDQRLALPSAAGASRQLTDVSRQWRPLIQRDDANVMEHLDENHDVSG